MASGKYRWMVYYRLCENFWWLFCAARWSQFRPNLSPKNAFLLDFTRILWFFWSLRLKLFDIAKDTVFAKILMFSNIFGFLPLVNWTPKWTKTVNFGCVLFDPKLKILKDFPNTVFVLMGTTSGQTFNKIKQYLGL